MTAIKPQEVSEEGAGYSKKRIRLAVSLAYFCMGLCFASWASRIPDIKTTLHLNDALFGSILFALPVGQFLMMSFSGKLVTHFGSHKILLFAFPTYTFFLSNIGLVQNGWQLAVALFLFGLMANYAIYRLILRVLLQNGCISGQLWHHFMEDGVWPGLLEH